MKVDPGTPAQGRVFFLIFGVVAFVTGCDGLLSPPDHEPNWRLFYKILYAIFGPYGDDYFSMFVGICMIYFGLFRFEDIKRNLEKYKKTR